jgi:2-C-methyl-D-erythritol 4-phosphate cytidylyltransferase/2-C-methyl-D-erythritol 2,4-cyclodiphosphate synthase
MSVNPLRATVIIVAGGKGVRMGGHVPKQYMELRGRPVLWHTLQAFERAECISGVIVVVAADDMAYCQQAVLGGGDFSKVRSLVAGGSERADSVRAGLGETKAEDTLILVHDAVRPFVSESLIERVVEAADRWGAALPALPVADTIKTIRDEWVEDTPNRNLLRAAQTPQGFRRSLLCRAHEPREVDAATDDAMLVEMLGEPVRIVAGEAENKKLTTPVDWAWATLHMAEETDMDDSGIRVGQGYDVHRLVEGRLLVLGGIEIPFHLGLDGHSDADVLTHAIIDALLGTIGGGDIGQLFPDSDTQYKDISSLILLERVREKLEEQQVSIVNIDAVVMAQQPKLAPHIPAICTKLASVLHIEESAISVKATTTERLGFVGREEGMASQAVALVRT